MTSGNTDAADLLRALRSFLGENDMMAYLAMMAVRMIEFRRVMKPTGSLYLHCDPTASHYLKILLDSVFGARSFRNEVVWKRAHTVKGNFGQGSKFFGRNTDSILFYSKTSSAKFNPVFNSYTPEYIESHYNLIDPADGRRYQLISMSGPGGAAKGNPAYEVMGITRYWRYSKESMADLISRDLVVQPSPGAVPRRKLYLDEGSGVPLQALWDDIAELNSQAQERLGYPTQKPLALLERMVYASSNKDDIVLDPFCGCGTAVHAAQKLGRRWIGIDITHLAIGLVERRLKAAFIGIQFEIHGAPKDLAGARDLADRDKYQFQWWAVSLVNAQPYGGKKRGADGGIDGKVFFKPDGKRTDVAIVSVKGGGNIGVGMIRDLKGVMEREHAPMGLFLTLTPPKAPMVTEAASAGFYETLWGRHPRIQILTIEDLLTGKRPDMPLIDISAAFKSPGREAVDVGEQPELAI